MRVQPRGFWDHISRKPPDTLYHYTSLESLAKIVSGRSLLATDSRFLNDTKEVIHLKNTILNRIETLLQEPQNSNKPALDWLLATLKSDQHDPVYVVSFSAKPDDLSQWRGYTPPGQGVCIGFRTSALKLALAHTRGERHHLARYLLLGKIIYLGENEGASFDDFIASVSNHIDIIDGEPVRTVGAERLIISAMPFYKHKAFKDEHEWRIRISANSVFSEDPMFVETRIGKSSLIPATRLSFRKNEIENSFIKEIIVGPTPNEDLSVYSMREFILAEGLSGVLVRASQVPYRNW